MIGKEAVSKGQSFFALCLKRAQAQKLGGTFNTIIFAL
ncbi:hypothetical protein CHRY9293_03654 [Chryseobacterium potabilaquae]|uniref:Uncharacterized protein n=1 Tax=Chryseobacterium potabilaquae TaxID=2675057 RepID=A0A6N4XFZ7_9FLAO|nr:hypothetical protein CHRY9293_03654 [Chryseobacterium potabilaquae]